MIVVVQCRTYIDFVLYAFMFLHKIDKYVDGTSLLPHNAAQTCFHALNLCSFPFEIVVLLQQLVILRPQSIDILMNLVVYLTQG